MIYADTGAGAGTSGEHPIDGDEYNIAAAVGVPDGVPFFVIIQNVGENPAFIGPIGTATTGYKLAPGAELRLDVPADGRSKLRATAFTEETVLRILATTGRT